MTLGDAKVGSTVVVTKIEGDGAYKRRIMDMGITKGPKSSAAAKVLYFIVDNSFKVNN